MKIIEKHYLGEYDEIKRLEISFVSAEWVTKISFGEGEPEDMTLNRDLRDAFDISNLLKAAYKAGENQEGFEFVKELHQDDED